MDDAWKAGRWQPRHVKAPNGPAAACKLGGRHPRSGATPRGRGGYPPRPAPAWWARGDRTRVCNHCARRHARRGHGATSQSCSVEEGEQVRSGSPNNSNQRTRGSASTCCTRGCCSPTPPRRMHCDRSATSPSRRTHDSDRALIDVRPSAAGSTGNAERGGQVEGVDQCGAERGDLGDAVVVDA
jgi:hypothetical protein